MVIFVKKKEGKEKILASPPLKSVKVFFGIPP
jgi:hypothetical protein